MGMTLRAVAEDRDGLAVEEGEVCVVVVVHAPRRLLKRIGRAKAPRVLDHLGERLVR